MRGKTAPPLKGRYTADQAYGVLLADQNLRVTPVGAVLVLQAIGPASPPGTFQPAAADSLSEIVVTGTRIRGAAPVGSNLITITRGNIEASGYATAQQIVQAIPQNFGGGANDTTFSYNNRNNALNNSGLGSSVNLRGLGAESTLVLINGSRPAMGGVAGLFADISLIPSSAIERVEVLPDGASALYGSDAVGGVVNFAMRDRFDGLETRLRYGTADGDLSEYQAGLVYGRSWGSGHLTAAYEFYDRGRLSADSRDYAREDLRAFGGGDNRKPNGSPGTLVAGGLTFALPMGNGLDLTLAKLTAGTQNFEDQQLGTDLLPAQRRHTVYLSGQQALTTKTRIFAQALYADRTFDRRYANSFLLKSTTVPVANPYYFDPIGTHLPVIVRYDYGGDLGMGRNRGRAQAYNAAAGLIQTLGDWSATAQVGYGRQRESWSTSDINTLYLAQAINSTNVATAYNLFGGPGSNPRSVIDSVRGFDSGVGVFEVWSSGLRADGPVFSLPAGAIRLALGAEWRSEEFKDVWRSYYATATPVTTIQPYPAARRIAAAYAEIRIPLVDQTMGLFPIGGLDLSLAGRVERYSDVGTTTNPKVGLDWKPTSTLTVRGSYGRSFRAPSFQDLRNGPSLTNYTTLALPDSRSPTGSTKALALIGNLPGLLPERAATWSAGLDFQPEFAPGLTVNLTYFNIAYNDRLANLNANLFSILTNRGLYGSVITDNPAPDVLAGYYASPYFHNSPGYAPSEIGAIVDVRNRNLSTVKEDGFDLDVGYGSDTSAGRFDTGLAATYVLGLKTQVAEGSPTTDVLGTVGYPVQLRMRARSAWSSGPWSVSGFVNYTDHYSNQTLVPTQRVKSWTTIDLQISRRAPQATGALAGLRISLSISNLFDADPPFAEIRSSSSAIGYDGEKASPVGRLIALDLVKSW